MADFSKIHERLFCGAMIKDASDVAELRAAGITHVVDACTDDEASLFPPSKGIELLSNPTKDDGKPKDVDWFEPAIDFAMFALSVAGNIVMTHCRSGHNRGPSLAYAIMRAQGWSAHKALSRLHRKRHATIGGIRYRADAEKALKELGWIK